ncbi:MAG: hypothetical protein KME13_27200 [Myxacorys californica WJT36-NPBG1]|nr:hypothetical protein [Myxacorys californica WJT36-NPBG1]
MNLSRNAISFSQETLSTAGGCGAQVQSQETELFSSDAEPGVLGIYRVPNLGHYFSAMPRILLALSTFW